MRRLIPLVLMTLLLTIVASPALGASYRETAMNYLKGRHGVPEDRIELYEGDIMDLELTAKSFWHARYMILSDDPPASGETKGSAPAPAPRPQLVPMPDGKAEPAILPMPGDDPGDVIKDWTIYGGIYISIKTGELLELPEMEAYFAAEQALWEIEWARLRGEAGKLDVSLYLTLKKVAPADKVSVWIQPSPVFTDSLRAQFSALKAKYPKVAGDMTFDDIFFYGNATILPAFDGVMSSEVTIDPAPGGTAPSREKPAPDERVIDDEYWREYEAFWQAVEDIRGQALAPSLAIIMTALDDLGASYKDSGNSLTADLTAAEIQVLAALPAVSAILEDMVFTTMDETLMFRGGTDAASPPPALAPKASGTGESAAAPPTTTSSAAYATAVLLIGGLMAFGLRAAYSRRK